jgi:hypothetical protein
VKVAGDDTIDLTEPVSNERLYGEMVTLRGALNRERWHKRLLLIAVVALFILGSVAAWNRAEIQREVNQNATTLHRLDDTQRLLDEQGARLNAQSATTNVALCGAVEGLLNAGIDEKIPLTVKDQWLRQAEINQRQADVEANLMSINCHLNLHPVPPPEPTAKATPEPKTTTRSPTAFVPSTSTRSAPAATPEPATTFAVPTMTLPPSTVPPRTTTTTTTTTAPCKRKSGRC